MLHPSNAMSWMCLTEGGIVMLLSELQYPKALTPMSVTEGGMRMLSKEVHPSKALSDMELTESGIVMLLSELQHPKALTPMSVTEGGMCMLSKELHPSKALSIMQLTESGIVMFLSELQHKKAPTPISVTAGGMWMLCKQLHCSNAQCPNCVTESGMVMPVKELQCSKTPFPMCVTESGILMLTKELHPAKALFSIRITDSGMLTLTILRQSWKAPSETSVVASGMFTWSGRLSSGISLLVTASISLLVYRTVTSATFVSVACNKPASTIVWDAWPSSINVLSFSNFTLRILRSRGCSQGACSSSITFNSRTVTVGVMSRMIIPPCKVFTFSLHAMAVSCNQMPSGKRRSQRQLLMTLSICRYANGRYHAENACGWNIICLSCHPTIYLPFENFQLVTLKKCRPNHFVFCQNLGLTCTQSKVPGEHIAEKISIKSTQGICTNTNCKEICTFDPPSRKRSWCWDPIDLHLFLRVWQKPIDQLSLFVVNCHLMEILSGRGSMTKISSKKWKPQEVLNEFNRRHTVDGRNPAPPGMSKNLANNGINYQPQLVIARFLNHQQ